MPKGHGRGSKGAAGGYGGYSRRYRWRDDRTGPMESARQREERARLIAEFIARGGRIKRFPLACAAGLPPAFTGEMGLDLGDAAELMA